MRKTMLALLLLVASGGAMADWKMIATGFRSNGYADLGTVRKDGNIATMRVLVDYERQPYDGDNAPYLSLKMEVAYDCQKQKFRTLTLTSYTGQMASGHQPYTSNDPGEWTPILPTNIQKFFWEAACGKQ